MSKDAKHYEPSIEKLLDIPFKDFMPGQIIQSSQFNDDMLDIEDKVNEIITKHNGVDIRLSEHQRNLLNPHCVTATQINAYEIEEVDEFINDVKDGNLFDESITNRVLADSSVDNRVLQDGAVTVSKVDSDLGSQLDLESNISIVSRYTKDETDAIIQEKVGDGTYSKEQIDAKFEEYQAGTIVDGTIDVSKLKDSVGRQIDITNNPSISDRYTKTEVDTLIYKNGLPKDWGGLNDSTDEEEGVIPSSAFGHLPISDVMTCGEFRINETDVLNVKIQDVEFAKGEFSTLEGRLDDVDNRVNNNSIEINSVKESFSGFVGESGYQKMPNGLIIQWGHVKGLNIKDGRVVDAHIAFPIEFPNAIFTFIPSVDTVDSNNYWASRFNIIGKTNNNRVKGWVYACNWTGINEGTTMDINYIAIGY